MRLVCENGLCMLKPVDIQETPVENEEPSITTMPTEEDQKKDDDLAPENPPEMELVESTNDENDKNPNMNGSFFS